MDTIPDIIMRCPKCLKEFSLEETYCEECTAMLEPVDIQEGSSDEAIIPSDEALIDDAPCDKRLEDAKIRRLKTDIEERFVNTLLLELRPAERSSLCEGTGTRRSHCEPDGCRLEPVAANVRPQLNSPVDAEDFRGRVHAIKDHIRAGDIIQAVLSQPFRSDEAPDPCRLYRAMRHVNPSPYLFFLHLDDTVLVGSSPETMVRLENGIATLRPIAGTRPRGRTEQEDRRLADELLKDEKERAEHVMLVDLGRNDLGRVAEIGSVQVTDLMVVERYSHVMHLVSNIRISKS